MRDKVLIVGLDGGTWSVLGPLLKAGRLPRLSALMARGTSGVLRSTVPAITLPAWTSLITGRNPGAHGVFAFRRLPHDRYDARGIANANDVRSATLWDIAGAAGLQVGVINVPPSYPLRPVHGFIVGCMLTPPGEKHFTEPPEVAAELGEYRINVDPPGPLDPRSPQYLDRLLTYLSALEEQTRWRGAATLRLMSRRPWDLLCVVFYAPDRLQHYVWPYVVGAPGALDPRVRALVERIWADLDEALGRLVDAAGRDTTIVVASDHGSMPAPDRIVRVNRWLLDQGLLVRRPLWSLRRKIIRKWVPRRWRARWDTDDHIILDRARTRAWCEPMDASREAAIWVHVRGRYPLGRVAPGEEYERVRQRIIDGLSALRDADGGRVFGDVRRREELYHGPYVGEAPDVIAVTTPSYAVSMQALRADLKADRVLGPFDSVAFNGQSGVHGDDGLYVFAGPRIAALGGHREYPIESIAPTVLHLLRLPVPRAMDGPVCASLLQPDDLAAHPVVFSDDEGTPAARAGDWASADDERVIADRLRSLGYIG